MSITVRLAVLGTYEAAFGVVVVVRLVLVAEDVVEVVCANTTPLKHCRIRSRRVAGWIPIMVTSCSMCRAAGRNKIDAYENFERA